MQFKLSADKLSQLESALPRLTPWMHPYRFNESTYTGYFKFAGQTKSYWSAAEDDPATLQTIGNLFDDYMGGQPFFMLDAALAHFGAQHKNINALDIACATGRFSFYLASKGVESVRGIEIRPEQVEQAQLIQTLAEQPSAPQLTFAHDPSSADDPNFCADQSYDLVLSMGLLYHLANPLQHIYNLARITKEVLVMRTLIHRRFAGYWQLVAEDEGFITKATQGVSWIPHYFEVARWLKQAGFSRVESLTPPTLSPIADTFALKQRSNPSLYADTIMRRVGLKPRIEAYSAPDKLRHGWHNPFYFTYIAYK